MLDFSNTMNNHHFALNDVELRILQPVFSQFHAKTGLSIDEYGDIVGANTGDQTGREICTSWYYNYPWTSVLRYVGDDTAVSKSSSQGKKSGWVKDESWYGVTEAICNVRSAPSTKSSVVAQYGKGEKIYYDSVYEGDGYRWISYKSYSGVRRYVAYRQLSGDTTPWIKIQ